MTRRGPFLFLVISFFALGIGMALFRNAEYHVPFLPGTVEQVWQVEASLDFHASGKPVVATLTLPPEQDGYRILRENAASPGYGYDVSEDAGQRRARWSKREATGNQTLFFKTEFVADSGHRVADSEEPPVTKSSWEEPYYTAVRDVLASALPLSADGMTLAEQLLAIFSMTPRNQNAALLLEQFELADLLSGILAEAGVPARAVEALVLEDGRRRRPTIDLVELWQDGSWHLLSPDSGSRLDERELLLWRTSAPSLFEVSGGTQSKVSFSMIRQARSTTSITSPEVGPSDPPLMSLYTLPVEEQGSFKLLMLLPIGALAVVLMRVLIGIKTSGTFMPVLIALAFLQTKLLPGLFCFVVIVASGAMIRSYLSQLRLLLVARIATLIVIVIGIISVFSVLGHQLGVVGAQTLTMFPTIILAWTIERMSIAWEEQGAREALNQVSGSLFVAVVAFLIMDREIVRHLVFNFPELHLCVISGLLLTGRYTGYRLLELRRFANFAELRR